LSELLFYNIIMNSILIYVQKFISYDTIFIGSLFYIKKFNYYLSEAAALL